MHRPDNAPMKGPRMARLPYLNQDDLPEEHKRLLERPANLFRALVHSPDAFRNFSRLGLWLRTGSTLDARLRELAILQVGYITRAEYEWSHHIRIGHAAGVTDDDIAALIAETNGETSALPELDRAVLRLAREMTEDLGGSEEAFRTVNDALGHEHTVDLLMTIAFYNLVVRLLYTLEVDLEGDDDRAVLEQYPLPA
jgi:alkylhydroperoxidase family enzyme